MGNIIEKLGTLSDLATLGYISIKCPKTCDSIRFLT